MLTAADILGYAPTATAATIRRALSDRRPYSAAASLALRAVASAFECDLRGAIGLLHRGIRHEKVTSTERSYLKELLIQYLFSTADLDGVENLLSEPYPVPDRLRPLHCSAKSLLHAYRGDRALSRTSSRRALSAASDADSPLIRAQTLSRCGGAAYYRSDFDEASELSIESAHINETHGAYAAAAASYSIAGIVAQDWKRDSQLAAAYFRRMDHNAKLAGHEALKLNATAQLFAIASDAHDVATYHTLRKRLYESGGPPQYHEHSGLLFAYVLGYAWNADFDAVVAALTAHVAVVEQSQPRLALIDALLSLTDAARWNLESARLRSRLALQRTADRVANAPLHERRVAELARIVGAATCFIIGDRVRGERALSERFDPGQKYRRLLTAPSIDTERFPEPFRGFAEFIRIASTEANRRRPPHSLTAAEVEVLRGLRGGATMTELARELKKSKNTVARQVESIYAKLNARNRAQALELARELEIFG